MWKSENISMINNERMQQKTQFSWLYYLLLDTQGTEHKVLQKKAENRFLGRRQPKIVFENATGNLVHLLNGWQTGNRKPRSCILPAEWKAMSLDPNRKDLWQDHACRLLQIEDKENHWSLECQQDRCGTLDPFQACPDGRRAHACSSRRSRGKACTCLPLRMRTPKEGTGYNWPAIPFRWREMIGKRKWGWNPNLKFSPFYWSTQGDTGKNEMKLTIFPLAGGDRWWKSQASIHSCRPHHQDTM